MEGFMDILDEIKKQGGPLMWITQKRNFLENELLIKSNKKRTPEQLKQDVLNSDRLKHVIDKLLSKQNGSIKRDEIEKEAKKILDEMAHQFDLKYVRLLGYVLIKVFSSIYQHIYYNSDIDTNICVLKQHPVILLPLHRSYMDFLLVSVICFHKNIQLPAVAAGQDFLGLSFLSNVIRHTGAFFIRRSFGSDELYWAIFHEYVQQHLSNCDRPLEFFIEGTRSRTSKSLQPKQGMLSTCVELYMRGHRTNDIYFIPISLTYEKLLEEILYSNELLGIPKPKETVSGLVKARSILNQTFGSIFINFSRPISLREVLYNLEGPNPLNRSNLLNPSFIFELNLQQFKTIESLSYIILLDMLRNQVIQPISLISTCLLMNKSTSLFDSKCSIDLISLCNQIEKFKRILINLRVKVYWPLSVNNESDLNSSDEYLNEMNRVKNLVLDNIELHSNLFDLESNESVNFEQNLKLAHKLNFNDIQMRLSLKQPHLLNRTESGLFESASFYIALCSYKNQLVNSVVRIAFVCNSLLASSVLDLNDDDLLLKQFDTINSFNIYKFITQLFNREFIFKEDDELKDFNDSLSYLSHTNLIKIDMDDKIQLVKFNLKQFLFFAKTFEQIIQNYCEIYDCLIIDMLGNGLNDEKVIVKKIQEKIFEKMLNKFKNLNNINLLRVDFEVLSLNMISNAINNLRQFQILSKNGFDLSKLNYLKEKLDYLNEINRFKINKLVKIANLFDTKTNHSISDRVFCFSLDPNDHGDKIKNFKNLFLTDNQCLKSKI